MRKPLKEKCGCGKELKLIGSPPTGFYTICECNKVGYFDDERGMKLYYQRETNNDDENLVLTDTE